METESVQFIKRLFVFPDLLISFVEIVFSQNQIQKIVRPIVCDNTALFRNLRVVEYFCILFLFLLLILETIHPTSY